MRGQAKIVPHDTARLPKTLLGGLADERWALPRALDWLARRQRVYPCPRLAANKYPLAEINQAFAAADRAAGQGQVARASLVP